MAEKYIRKFEDNRISTPNIIGIYFDLDNINQNGIFVYNINNLNKPSNNFGIVINLSFSWIIKKYSLFIQLIKRVYYRDKTNNI